MAVMAIDLVGTGCPNCGCKPLLRISNSRLNLLAPGVDKCVSLTAQITCAALGNLATRWPFPNRPVGLTAPINNDDCCGPGLLASPMVQQRVKIKVTHTLQADKNGIARHRRCRGLTPSHSGGPLLWKSCSILRIWSSSLLSMEAWKD